MSKLRKNIVYQLFYRLLTVLTPLITSPYLSRTLGPDKLGIYSATYAYANYFILFAILGIEVYGNRSIAIVADDVAKRRQCFWNIYAVQFVASAISLMTYYCTIRTVFDSSRIGVCLLQGIWVMASAMDINWYFFGKQEFQLTVTRNTIIKILSIICIFSFVHNPEDLSIYVFIMSFSMLASQIVLWFFLFRDIGFCKPEYKQVLYNVKPIMLLFVPVLAMSVFHIMDKTMVDLLSDETNGGYYYNVDRLVNIPLGLITGLGTVMLPRISKLSHDHDSEGTNAMLRKSSELLMFLTCAISFGIGSISRTFVPVFFGPGYEPCIVMIEVFIPIIMIKAISDFIRQQYLIPTKRDNLYIVAVSCGAFVNLLANYFLILRYEALGAVFGTFIAEGIVLLIELTGSISQVNFMKLFGDSAMYVLIGIVMFLVVRLLENSINLSGVLKLLVLILTGGGIYLILCLIYWLLTPNSIFKQYVVNKKTN